MIGYYDLRHIFMVKIKEFDNRQYIETLSDEALLAALRLVNTRDLQIEGSIYQHEVEIDLVDFIYKHRDDFDRVVEIDTTGFLKRVLEYHDPRKLK